MPVKGRKELKIFWFCICNVPEPHNHEVLINCLGFNPQHRCDFLLGTSAHNDPLNLTLCLETLGPNDRKLHIFFIILNSYRASGMGPRINHTFHCKVGKFVINGWGKKYPKQQAYFRDGNLCLKPGRELGNKAGTSAIARLSWREHTQDC